MNKQINLGTFSWDTNKIEHQITANTMEMQKFANTIKAAKDQMKEQSKQIAELEKRIESEHKKQARLTDELNKGTRSKSSYNEEIKKSNEALSNLVLEQQQLVKSQAEGIVQVNRLQRSTEGLRSENAELNRLLAAGRKEISGNEGAYRNLNKELNALKTEAKNLGAQMVVLEKQGKKNTPEYDALAEQFAETAKKADQLNDKFKEIDKSVGDNHRTVGDYKDQIKSALSEVTLGIKQMSSGDIKGGFQTIVGGFGDIKNAAGSLFNFLKANPWLLLIGAVFGYVKEMYEYNQQVREMNKEVEQLANTSGELTDELRKNSIAIQETYGKDFKEAVLEQKALMDDFKISAQEAFDVYNQGLAMGGAANGEFGESIREYGPLMAQAGYSAQEFVNILNSGIDLGVYNDKLPDAIKEAYLSLTEQTKATRDALVNAFGASFADDILKRIQSGKITVAQALDEISEKSKTANLNQQQLAQLTADVFKGAGEDAGGALMIFEAINNAQEVMSGNLTEVQQKTIELANLNKELEDAKDAAYKSDSVQSMQYQVQELWKKTQIFFLDILAWFQKADRATIKSSSYMRGWFKGIPEAANATFQAILKSLAELIKGFQSGGSAISKFLKGDLDGAKADADKFMSALPNAYKTMQSALSTALSNMSKSAETEQKKTLKSYDDTIKAQAEIQKRLGNNKTTGATGDAEAKDAAARKQAETKAIADRKKAADEQKRLAEQAAKEELERLKINAEASSKLAQNELAEYIANNVSKLESDKRFSEQSIALEKERLEEIKRLKLAANTAEMEKAMLGKTEAEKDQIRREFAIKEIEINNETQEQIDKLNKKFAEQQAKDNKLRREIEQQQKIVELETNMANEYEVRQELLEQQRENDLIALEEQRAEGLISLENFEAQKKLIEAKFAQEKQAIEEARQQAVLSGYASVFGNIAQLLGQNSAAGKTAAIAEATITGYAAVLEAYKTAQKSPITIINPAYPYIQAGLAGAFSAAQIAKIVSTKVGGYATGGLINGGFPITRSNGDNRLITAKDGEVVLNEVQQRLLGGPDVFRAIGVPGFATGGKVGNIPTVQKSILNKTPTYAELSPDSIAMIQQAIYNGSQTGMRDLNTNIKIQQGANF